jgi:ribonuclease BN (tRNA processing enzyme)
VAARGKKAEGPIRWTTLGSAPYPKANEPCSGYLLQGGGANVLVDVGGGVLGPLQHLMNLDDLHAVWISHMHADHFADMPLLYYAFAYAEKPMRKIPVLAPPGWAKRVEDFVRSATDHHMSTFFQVVELKDRGIAENGSPRDESVGAAAGTSRRADLGELAMERDMWEAMRGVKAIVLAVRHAAYLALDPDDVFAAVGRPFAIVDCFAILDDARIRRYLELGCEVKGLGRGHIKRIKESIRTGEPR